MASEYQPPLSTAPPPQKSSKVPWILGGCAVLLLLLIGIGVGGFFLYRWKTSSSESDVNSETPPTRNVNLQQPDTGGNSASSTNVNAPAPPPPTAAGKPTSWETSAASLNGEVGAIFTLACTPHGTQHSVWGSDIYTADSSICTAAVHAGLITVENGGTVTIELRPGRSVYGNSERNGITTSVYGEYGKSFVFKSAEGTPPKISEELIPITWNVSTGMLSDAAGKSIKFLCPSNGVAHSIWGTDAYTGDSSICTAAVHAGTITFARGGPVTLEFRPGQASYKGSTRNGVTSSDYGKYGRSFAVR
jgi:hypothetical protein